MICENKTDSAVQPYGASRRKRSSIIDSGPKMVRFKFRSGPSLNRSHPPWKSPHDLTTKTLSLLTVSIKLIDNKSAAAGREATESAI